MHRLVRLPDVQRLRVGVRIDRDGADAEAPRGADDPAGDLAAIGDEEGRSSLPPHSVEEIEDDLVALNSVAVGPQAGASPCRLPGPASVAAPSTVQLCTTTPARQPS